MFMWVVNSPFMWVYVFTQKRLCFVFTCCPPFHGRSTWHGACTAQPASPATKPCSARPPALSSGTEKGGTRDAPQQTQEPSSCILPMPPNISTWLGKAHPVPEIGRLRFHCAFRGHTCTFLPSFDSLFCILDSNRSLHVEDSKLDFLINCLGLYLYWLLI